MEKLLILLDVDAQGSLSKAALEVVQSARALAQSLNLTGFDAGLVGGDVQPAADQIALCGAASFLAASGPAFQSPRYASDAAAAEAIARATQATLIIAPGNSRWLRVLSGVAYRLNGRFDSHITGISATNGKLVCNRWFYRQRMEAAFLRSNRPWILAQDPGVQTPWNGPPGKAIVTPIAVPLSESFQATTVAGVQSPPSDAQTIRPDAQVLLVAGAGWTKKQADGQMHTPEAQKLILDFLRHAQASLGGTKSIVDLSSEGQAVLPFMTHLNQVGQTGSTPRHPKGLATCCHGEEPHVVGWRFIKERRVVNLDPNCSWTRGKADVVYVADAFQVMAKVNELLQT
jgi:electron transfer flavoprotein alpha subunit